MALEDFINGYVQCALWLSSNDEGTPFDELGVVLADSALADIRSDCEDFYNANCHLWHNSIRTDDQFAGHDFWLTRNRHGVGFWDRGLGEIGKKLTELSHAYGEAYLIEGDDGLIYHE